MSQSDILIYGKESPALKGLHKTLDKIGFSFVFLGTIGSKSIDEGKACLPIVVLVDTAIITGGLAGVEKSEALLADIDAPVIYLITDPNLKTTALISERNPIGHIFSPFFEEKLQNAIDINLYNHLLSNKADETNVGVYSTLKSLNEAIIVTDTQGHITFANPIAEALSGQSGSDIVGENLAKRLCITEEKSGERFSTPPLSLDKPNCGIPVNLTIKNTQGRQIPVENKTSVMKDDNGNISGIVWAFTDQTKKREAENKLRKLSQAVEQSPATIVITDLDGNIEYVNPKFTETTGYSYDEAMGQNPRILKSGHTSSEEYKGLWETISAGDEWRGELLNNKKNGEQYWEAASISPMLDKEGNITHYLAVKEDITERKKTERELQESQARLTHAQRIAHMGHWELDITNNKLDWSEEIYHIFGFTEESFEGTYEAFLESVHQDDRQLVTEHINKTLYQKEPYSLDHRIILPGGEERVVHEEGEVEYSSEGKPVKMMGTVQDITERKKTELEFKKLSSAIEQSVNIIFLTDIEGTIEYVNSTFENITGYSRKEVLGTSMLKNFSYDISPKEYLKLKKALKDGKNWRASYKSKKKNGGYYWVNTLTSPIKDERGVVTHFLSVQEDITEKKLSDERIEYLASYDELTGLINRNKFMELIKEQLAHVSKGVLLIVDIDDFKILNDTLGHHMGDKYLFIIAETLKDEIKKCRHKKGCILGRLGSDEFAIFLTEVDIDCGTEIAEAIRKKIEHCHEGKLPTQVTASIGVVLFPEHGTERKELFTKGDAAIYRAKELGQNLCHLYLPEDRYLEEMHSKAEWKKRIQTALKEDRFEIWLQPISNLKTDEIYHYEVLARMRDDDGSIIPPATFIAMAEIFGLIGEIDRVITYKAMCFQAKLAKAGKNISLGMNLSGKDLEDDKLLEFLSRKIEETGADPKALHFEITETAAIHDLSSAIDFITALKKLGCLFSLDDFGVGFTSFVYLREMPVDYIKIDGSFIKNLHKSKNDRLFVKAITDVARGMGIKTIAEFVECGEIIPILKDYQVDYAQGYFIGKPAPAANFLTAGTEKAHKTG